MSPSISRLVIVVSGLLGVVSHAALTILVTIGLSLGRQADDPWTAPAEILVGVAFFGSLGVVAVLTALVYRMQFGLFLAYVTAWVVVSGSLVATIVIEFGWAAVTIGIAIASPVIAMACIVISFWARRSNARASRSQVESSR